MGSANSEPRANNLLQLLGHKGAPFSVRDRSRLAELVACDDRPRGALAGILFVELQNFGIRSSQLTGKVYHVPNPTSSKLIVIIRYRWITLM